MSEKRNSHRMSVANTVVIHEGAKIGNNVVIHDYVVIYPDSVIEDNTEIFDHCVIGKIPMSAGGTSRILPDKYNSTIIGAHSVLSPGCVIYRGTSIGEHVLLGDHASISENCRIGDYCIISKNVSVNYNTVIGNHVKVMDNSHITGNAVIEDDVFISVLVSTTNDNGMGRDKYTDGMIGPKIKRGVRIGAGANILPGIIIEEDSVIGAGSVVTKNVDKKKLVMGVPGRVVREIE